MKPNSKLITIHNNLELIKHFLDEVVLQPRINALNWSKITKQTASIKIGYPGQHLASLITGVQGERTGARGNDLVDRSEVKSCSRIDQLDSCNDCNAPVSRLETSCPECGSTNISRKNDSKWLFGVRDESELNVLLHEVQRVLLLIADYPYFEASDYDTLRFQSFEIWPESERHHHFCEIMTNYYQKIYLEHKKLNPNKTPAPKNFWPYQYQFYMCNPILTFLCIVKNANSAPVIDFQEYVEPNRDRSVLPSILMPPDILTENEFDLILSSATQEQLNAMLQPSLREAIDINKIKLLPLKQKRNAFAGIDENLRKYLPLRETDRIAVAKSIYTRRKRAP